MNTNVPTTGDEPLRLLTPAGSPRRDQLSSRLDKSAVFAGLFGGAPARIGRFALLEKVGVGGMGEIFAAYDERLDRKVAVKLVRSQRMVSPESEARLLREARHLARLNHPNVVQIYEVGTFEGRLYIAMEFIRGGTLRTWLSRCRETAGRHGQGDILRQFIAAGRGLQAAHKAGLVHLDFKPENVLIGDDGSARVVDFGLAQAMTERTLEFGATTERADPTQKLTPVRENADRWDKEVDPFENADTRSMDDSMAGSRGLRSSMASEPEASESLRHQRALANRSIVGTPRYMSPEQMNGRPVDHRSDQFSFCVALFEALYGDVPFSGGNFFALRASVETGAIQFRDRSGDVPAALRRILVRGLATDPNKRFPHMNALLDELERAMKPVKPWMWAAAAAVVAGVAVGGYFLAPHDDACSLDSAKHTLALSPERIQEIHTAFAATGLPYATATWDQLHHSLDDYRAAWRNRRVDACEATYVHRTRSRELFDRSMACLDEYGARWHALVESFVTADAHVVERAAQAVADLPALDRCSDAARLLGVAPPDDADLVEVMDIREELATARTLELLGDLDGAMASAASSRMRAETTGYGPVQAQALYQLARVHMAKATGADIAAGEELLARSLAVAEQAGFDELSAEVWVYRLRSAARNRRHDAAATEWAEYTLAKIHRAGAGARWTADVFHYRGAIRLNQGRLAEAESDQRRGLALLDAEPNRETRQAGHLSAKAIHLYGLAETVQARGRLAEAEALYQTVASLYRELLGDDHPAVADVLFDIATVQIARGQWDRGEELLRRALAVQRQTLGPAHPHVGRTLLELAEIERQRGHLVEAYRLAAEGRVVYEQAYSPNHAKMAFVHTRFAAIAYAGGAYADALAAFQAALAIDIQVYGAEHEYIGSDRLNLADTLVMLGQPGPALDEISAVEDLVRGRDAQVPGFDANMFSIRGRAYLQLKRYAAAVKDLETARDHFREVGNGMVLERAHTDWALAQALDAGTTGAESTAQNSSRRRAVALAEEALDLYRSQHHGEQLDGGGNPVMPLPMPDPIRQIESWLTRVR